MHFVQVRVQVIGRDRAGLAPEFIPEAVRAGVDVMLGVILYELPNLVEVFSCEAVAAKFALFVFCGEEEIVSLLLAP